MGLMARMIMGEDCLTTSLSLICIDTFDPLTAIYAGRGVTRVQNDPGSHDDHFPLLGLRDLRMDIPVGK